MNKLIFKAGFVNAIYFSAASFVMIWLTGFLYELLEKTRGKINIGAAIMIVVAGSLIVFSLGLTNIFLADFGKPEPKLYERFFSCILFVLISFLILLSTRVSFLLSSILVMICQINQKTNLIIRIIES